MYGWSSWYGISDSNVPQNKIRQWRICTRPRRWSLKLCRKWPNWKTQIFPTQNCHLGQQGDWKVRLRLYIFGKNIKNCFYSWRSLGNCWRLQGNRHSSHHQHRAEQPTLPSIRAWTKLHLLPLQCSSWQERGLFFNKDFFLTLLYIKHMLQKSNPNVKIIWVLQTEDIRNIPENFGDLACVFYYKTMPEKNTTYPDLVKVKRARRMVYATKVLLDRNFKAVCFFLWMFNNSIVD